MHLSADDQRNLRDAAARAWIGANGRYLLAARLFKKDPRVAKFDAVTIITLMMYAYQLWKWWNANKVSEPDLVPMGGEPSFGGAQ
tara:strand:- start:3748 stop:4002 length:255 start_codon:yes stop_codon:yes gene_type:complete